jgi:hypothetical protein
MAGLFDGQQAQHEACIDGLAPRGRHDIERGLAFRRNVIAQNYGRRKFVSIHLPN